MARPRPSSRSPDDDLAARFALVQLQDYRDASGELIFLAEAQLLLGGQPVISGSLESCLENWTLLPAASRAMATINVARPVKTLDGLIQFLEPASIAKLAKRYRIAAPRQRTIDRAPPAGSQEKPMTPPDD